MAKTGKPAGEPAADIEEPCVPTILEGEDRDAIIADLGFQVLACDGKRAGAVDHIKTANRQLGSILPFEGGR